MLLNALGIPGGTLPFAYGPDSATWPTARVYPVFVTSEFETWELTAASASISCFLVFCYGICYFFCCREWWCQHDRFRKFQYF